MLCFIWSQAHNRYTFYIFIVFIFLFVFILLCLHYCICFYNFYCVFNLKGGFLCGWGARKILILVWWLEIILSLCFPKPLAGHRQAALGAGRPDNVPSLGRCWPRSTPALPTPSHTQARPGGSWSGRRLLLQPSLSFVPPRPLQYLCKRGRALYKHCHSLCDHRAFHTHLVQVEGE